MDDHCAYDKTSQHMFGRCFYGGMRPCNMLVGVSGKKALKCICIVIYIRFIFMDANTSRTMDVSKILAFTLFSDGFDSLGRGEGRICRNLEPQQTWQHAISSSELSTDLCTVKFTFESGFLALQKESFISFSKSKWRIHEKNNLSDKLTTWNQTNRKGHWTFHSFKRPWPTSFQTRCDKEILPTESKNQLGIHFSSGVMNETEHRATKNQVSARWSWSSKPSSHRAGCDIFIFTV